jgi:carbamoyl-phosphate synthase large subunit
MKVVVTGAGALLGQGMIRSLLDSSLSVDIVAVDPSPLAASLYWVPNRRLLPMANDPRYIDAIEKLLAEERPDALLVGTDVELEILALHRHELEQRFSTHVVVSSPEVVRIADDKYKTYQFFRQHGFDAPDSCLPGEESVLVERVGFPLIVKPRIGARSAGVSKVRNWEELRHALATAERPVVIQECVATDADEYTAGTLTFDGQCRASIVMRRDLRDGNTYRAFVEAYPELNAMVRRMAESLGAYGPANFQFRLAGGKVKVFEINGRFSGTTPLRMHAGFNEVEMTLRHILKGEPIVQPEVQPITILRHWSETVVRSSELVSPA